MELLKKPHYLHSHGRPTTFPPTALSLLRCYYNQSLILTKMTMQTFIVTSRNGLEPQTLKIQPPNLSI